MLRLISILMLLFLGCTTFPTKYERIEEDKVRLIDFIYEPPEASPGDTVNVRAVFSGRKVLPEDLSWKISYKVLKNYYGFDTALDVHPLEYSTSECHFSENTSCISFNMVIPRNIIRESPSVPEDLLSLLPEKYRKMIPDEFARLKKNDLLNMVEMMASQIKKADETALKQISSQYDSIMEFLPQMLQYLTVQLRIFAKVDNWHTIQSDYSVRYNSIFSRLPGADVFVNTNPVIDSVGIYMVEGRGRQYYDPAEKKHKFLRLYGPDDPGKVIQEVLIDTSNTSYFVVAFTSRKDPEVTIEGNLMTEDHWTSWYYKLDPEETEGVSRDDFMDIVSMGDPISLFITPASRKIKTFTLWLEVTDRLLNVVNRPQGSMVKEVRGKFRYK